MLISKEARSAACEAFDQSYFHDAKDSDERLYIALMAGIEAALAAAPAGAVSIKPLEWVEHGDDAFEWHRAIPPVGNRYNIEDDGFSAKRLTLTVGQLVIGNFEKLETAKSAAQSHYEAAIRSALVPLATEPATSYYCTDCENKITRLFNGRCGCGSGRVIASPVTQATDGWQTMDTAPKDGKHCILAVQEGVFVWSVQGAYDGSQWNAVHRSDVQPLAWMPNVRVPDAFLPWVAATTPEAEGEQ